MGLKRKRTADGDSHIYTDYDRIKTKAPIHEPKRLKQHNSELSKVDRRSGSSTDRLKPPPSPWCHMFLETPPEIVLPDHNNNKKFGELVCLAYERSVHRHYNRIERYGWETATRYRRGHTPEEIRKETRDAEDEAVRRELATPELPPDVSPKPREVYKKSDTPVVSQEPLKEHLQTAQPQQPQPDGDLKVKESGRTCDETVASLKYEVYGSITHDGGAAIAVSRSIEHTELTA